MLSDLRSSGRIVGTKQVLKALSGGCVEQVFIALDADQFLQSKLCAACDDAGVQYTEVSSMKELGTACGIDVGSACAAVTKEPR